jgi:hypothetical protein
VSCTVTSRHSVGGGISESYSSVRTPALSEEWSFFILAGSYIPTNVLLYTIIY